MFTDLIILFTVYNQQPNKLPFFEASNKCQILLNREISREGELYTTGLEITINAFKLKNKSAKYYVLVS